VSSYTPAIVRSQLLFSGDRGLAYSGIPLFFLRIAFLVRTPPDWFSLLMFWCGFAFGVLFVLRSGIMSVGGDIDSERQRMWNRLR
jgi:hypothetical protein